MVASLADVPHPTSVKVKISAADAVIIFFISFPPVCFSVCKIVGFIHKTGECV